MRTLRNSPRKPDQFDSALRLMCSFVASLGVGAIAKLWEGSRGNSVWLYLLLLVLVTTSFRMGFFSVVYNALVVSLTYNFFFLSSDQELIFQWREIDFALLFLGAALVSSFVGRRVPESLSRPNVENRNEKLEPRNDFQWEERVSASARTRNGAEPWTW